MTLPNNWTDDGSAFHASDQNDVANDVNANTTAIAALPGSITDLFIRGEQPTGTQDGTNEEFFTANPYVSGSTAVYRNGLREEWYTESSSTAITFSAAPLVTDTILIDYVMA